MGIRVISQDTSERDRETVELFNQIKPLLDDGYFYSSAVRLIKGGCHSKFYQRSWFKDLVRYGESQGYLYDEYSGR